MKITRCHRWRARRSRQVGRCLMTTVGHRVGGGGGLCPLSLLPGGLLPVDVTDAPTLSVEGPQSVPSRISVVRVDGTIAEDTPGRECPREDRDGRPRAGVTRPAGVSVGGSGAGSLHGGGTLPSLDVAGSLLPAVPTGGSPPGGAANPGGPDGPVVAGGFVGPCETLSQIFHKNLDPFWFILVLLAGMLLLELMDSDVGSVADLASDSLDIEICCDSDVGSVADLEWNTWNDACALAFQGAGGAFPPEAAVIRPAVVNRDIFFARRSVVLPLLIGGLL